jgi:hypothetical protein
MIQRLPWRSAGYFLLAVIGIGFIAWMVIAVRDAQEAARSTQCRGRLAQIHLALHNYHDTYGSFPPAYIADQNGKPMHSWRVLIMPFLDGNDFYQQYRFDEPWDSPHHQQIAKRYENIRFHCPSGPHGTGNPLTNYVVIVGDQTAFPGSSTTSLSDFIDGEDNTLMLVEIRDSGIHWMEPRDLTFNEMSFTPNDASRPSISSPHRIGPAVVFADSIRSYRVQSTVRAETLRAFATIAGHEDVQRDALLDTDGVHGIFLSEPR